MLTQGYLTRDDFDWLVFGKKDLAALHALKQKQLTTVALDRFINGLIDIIVPTAFRILV